MSEDSRTQTQSQQKGNTSSPVSRKPIWGERGEDTCAPQRAMLADKVPDHTDAPWYVRMWIAAYMRYRGLNDAMAENVHYTGAEFQGLDLPAIVDLFIVKCGLSSKEADIIGQDVWELVQDKLPPVLEPTGFDRFARFIGEDAMRLRALTTPGSSVMRRIGCLLLWVRVLFKSLAVFYVGVVFGFLALGLVYGHIFP
ncbi:uncharacterized protein JN550_012621 [Neoarthrinium moseri]|uniref:uncharacterized protein n=1 Tax=Neoarthrinium moseri TaxID=1658444 RepID=UPI001FDDB711|nr:uncharacterized protein JN550_012621 [Neoarthrinium moseri]KAI1858488.1 hypothetical protein JN550_012621 [Neoarthrinium moseri]